MSYISGITKKEQKIIDKFLLVKKLRDAVSDNPFWASEVSGLCSPSMLNEFKRLNILEHTGETKESFICIDEYNDVYKKTIAQQWVFRKDVRGFLTLKRDVRFILAKYERRMTRAAETYQKLLDYSLKSEYNI